MAAYLINNSEVTDQALFTEFTSGMTSFVAAHNGKFLARGGATQVVGGNWTPHRLVIIEFESLEQVQSWVSLPEYAELAAIRDKSSNSSTIIVDGI